MSQYTQANDTHLSSADRARIVAIMIMCRNVGAPAYKNSYNGEFLYMRLNNDNYYQHR